MFPKFSSSTGLLLLKLSLARLPAGLVDKEAFEITCCLGSSGAGEALAATLTRASSELALLAAGEFSTAAVPPPLEFFRETTLPSLLREYVSGVVPPRVDGVAVKSFAVPPFSKSGEVIVGFFCVIVGRGFSVGAERDLPRSVGLTSCKRTF